VAEGNETAPQSGSGGEEQTKSKAATGLEGSPLRSVGSIDLVLAYNGGVEGRQPLIVSWGFKGGVLFN